jgi:hypothetical protein
MIYISVSVSSCSSLLLYICSPPHSSSMLLVIFPIFLIIVFV